MSRLRNLAVVVGLTLPASCAAIYGVTDLPGDVGGGDAASDASRDAHTRPADASRLHDGSREAARDAGPDTRSASDASPDAREASALDAGAEAGFSVASVAPAPAVLLQGGSAMVTVTLASAATADVPITANTLPSGVSVMAGNIPAGATSGVITLAATAAATEGAFSPVAQAGVATQPFTLIVEGATATFDTSFNQSGVQNITPSGGDSSATARSVAIQPDNAILIAGTRSTSSSSGWALVRLNPDGTPDTAFDANVVDPSKGTLLPAAGSLAGVAVIPSTGLIVVAGYDTDSGLTELTVFLFNPDGSRYEAFGTAGMFQHGPEEGFHVTTVTGVAVNPAGDIAVVGNTAAGYVATLSGPSHTLNIASGFPSGVVLQGVTYEPNGDIVVGGTSPSGGGQLYIGRVTTPALALESFADGGLFGPTGTPGNQFLIASAIASDLSGDIFLVGNDDLGDPVGAYAYLPNSGSPGLAGGYGRPGPPAMNGSGYLGVACGAADNLAVVVGDGYDMAGNIAYVARINSLGTLNPSFGTNGVHSSNGMTVPVYNAVAIDSFGRIVVVGADVGFYAMRIWP